MPESGPTHPPHTPPSHADDDAHDRAIVAEIRRFGLTTPEGKAAWGALFVRYQDRLFAICFRMVPNRHTAADLTQDAFVKLLGGLDSYDGRSKLSTWIFRVTMNVCLSHLRAAKLRDHVGLETIAPSISRTLTGGVHPQSGGNVGDLGRRPTGIEQGVELPPDQGVEHEQRRHQVARALSALDVEQRAILVLRDVQGLEYDQIASVLEVAVGTVKSRLFRARAALRAQLEE